MKTKEVDKTFHWLNLETANFSRRRSKALTRMWRKGRQALKKDSIDKESKMKLTKDQATKILDDFRHFDGRKISIGDGQIGEYPVVIVLPLTDSLNKKCRLDIYDKMRNQEQLIRAYDLGDFSYTVQVFFRDLIPNNTLDRHTDLEKWLKTIGVNFDKNKYGIE